MEIVLLGNLKMYLDFTIVEVTDSKTQKLDIQLFRERLLEKICTRQSRKVLWDMINTLFLRLSMSTLLFLLSFSTRNYNPMASRAILSNFFEKQWTQNRPQYLSGLSRALFRQPFSKKLYIQSLLVFLSCCAIHARSMRYANLDIIINLHYARRGINCGRQGKPAILISRLLLRMCSTYVANIRLDFH